MKNIIIALLLGFSVNLFSFKKWDSLPVTLEGLYFSDSSSTIKINASNAVTINMKSYKGEYKYNFSKTEANFKSLKTNQETDSIKLKNIQIISVQRGEHDGDKNILKNLDSKAGIIFKVGGVISIKKDARLDGKYISNNIAIVLRNNEEHIVIPIYFIIEMERALKLEVKSMDLGKIVIGEKASTKNQGSPGWLYIEGKSSEIEISYDEIIKIYNEDSKKLEVSIITNMPKKFRINENEKNSIRFDGEIKNTQKAIPGNYRGDLIIKVKYEN